VQFATVWRILLPSAPLSRLEEPPHDTDVFSRALGFDHRRIFWLGRSNGA
jgi:hypothetical protein